MSDKSRQTIYGRSTPEERKRIREAVLMFPCGYCGAQVGQKCTGAIGKPAQPHSERQVAADNAISAVDALQTQEGGSHYKEMKIQPVEFITANRLGFCAGNVIKYVCRHSVKNGREDLLKARHYIDLLIQLEYPDPPPP
jgi:hypothetical protein